MNEVISDVAAGYVTVTAARDLYKVAVIEDAGGYSIDERATKALREAR
ncbi:hypothetical protein [Naasia aerilata]|uniref:Uncharacterized protein n=1 Tax=Naasia aerilata TaxID=1162966 RepID=A0ABM8GH89_9MICO|nr:hypothetical protein [Naasia aerilata]BDZ44102.1 hypothetical protein GCM10025866_00110 [Naasia aerilata]BDZ47713.1 hypothetical protein GCM10025866_36220 [Naasia aerilata]